MNKRIVWNFELNDQVKIASCCNEGPATAETWEFRAFWPEDKIIVLNGIELACLTISHYRIKRRQDIYYLFPEQDFNIKMRRDRLVYKPILQKKPHAIAFGKKIKLNDKVIHALPNTPPAFSNLEQLKRLGTAIQVDKEALIYRSATYPATQFELARLQLASKIYFSFAIESCDYTGVTQLAQQILPQQVTTDYVTFLKEIMQ